jgi:hypothetical protein
VLKPKKVKGEPAAKSDNYLAGMDLPSSEGSDEEYEKSARAGEEQGAVAFGVSGESRKIADKERKTMEKAYQMKQEAMREDDNVFDVAFEGQGGDAAAIFSATDVKVWPCCCLPLQL